MLAWQIRVQSTHGWLWRYCTKKVMPEKTYISGPLSMVVIKEICSQSKIAQLPIQPFLPKHLENDPRDIEGHHTKWIILFLMQR